MQQRLEFWVGSQRLVGDLHLPDNSTAPIPCVVTSHGYKSHRDGDKYMQIACRFPLEGIAVLRFDHRGALNGESDGEFRDTTLSRRAEDLLAAIGALDGIREIDPNRLGLLGSSFGGMAVLVAKSEKVKAKVAMATPFAFPPPSEEMRSALAEKGYYQYPDGSRINKEFFEDVRRLDLTEEVRQTRCPLLIIHGDLDEVVPRHHARVLYQAAGSQTKDLRMIEGGDHSFTDPGTLNKVIRLALDWFKLYL